MKKILMAIAFLFCITAAHAAVEIVDIHHGIAIAGDAMCISKVEAGRPYLYTCNADRDYSFYGFYIGKDDQGRPTVTSSGVGFVNVANKGADISVGDLLTTSNFDGHLMRQKNNLLIPATAARALEAVVWSEGETDKKIKAEIVGQTQ